MPSNGAGWQVYRPRHEKVQKCIEAFAAANDRNDIGDLGDGRFVWYREADSDGKGVAKGNTESDFLRFVANAITHPLFVCSTIKTDAGKADDYFDTWDFRSWARQMVETMESGWQPTRAEATATIERTLEVTVTIVVKVTA